MASLRFQSLLLLRGHSVWKRKEQNKNASFKNCLYIQQRARQAVSTPSYENTACEYPFRHGRNVPWPQSSKITAEYRPPGTLCSQTIWLSKPSCSLGSIDECGLDLRIGFGFWGKSTIKTESKKFADSSSDKKCKGRGRFGSRTGTQSQNSYTPPKLGTGRPLPLHRGERWKKGGRIKESGREDRNRTV